MAVIAEWGGLTFGVSQEKTIALKDIKERAESSIATHACLARREKVQWISYNAGTLSMSIVFDSMICKKPYKNYLKLKDLEGYVSPLMIGTKRIGYHNWMLTSIEGDYARIFNGGAISRIEASVKFTEYYMDYEAAQSSADAAKLAAMLTATGLAASLM